MLSFISLCFRSKRAFSTWDGWVIFEYLKATIICFLDFSLAVFISISIQSTLYSYFHGSSSISKAHFLIFLADCQIRWIWLKVTWTSLIIIHCSFLDFLSIFYNQRGQSQLKFTSWFFLGFFITSIFASSKI